MIKINYHGGDIYQYTQEVIDFSSNINPLGIPSSFRNAIEENLSCIERYPDLHYKKLTSSIEKYLKMENRGIKIVLGNGAVEVIYKTIEYLPIKRIIIAAPTFSEYKRAATMNNIPILEVELYNKDGRLNMKKLSTLIEDEDLVILCNPNNPTGTLIPKEQLIDLTKRLKERSGYLMLDETFIEFTTNYPQTSMLDENMKNLVIIRALTKYFGMPGLRLGYGVFMDQSLGEEVNKMMEPWHINALADLAGQMVLHDDNYQKASRKWIETERKRFLKDLDKLNHFTYLPTESNFILMTSSKCSSIELQEMLLVSNLIIRMPHGFKGLNEHHFRIAIKDRASNQIMYEALKEIDLGLTVIKK